MIPILLTVVLFAQLAPSSSAALHFQAGLVRSKQAEPDRDRHRGIQQAISLEPSNPVKVTPRMHVLTLSKLEIGVH